MEPSDVKRARIEKFLLKKKSSQTMADSFNSSSIEQPMVSQPSFEIPKITEDNKSKAFNQNSKEPLKPNINLDQPPIQNDRPKIDYKKIFEDNKQIENKLTLYSLINTSIIFILSILYSFKGKHIIKSNFSFQFQRALKLAHLFRDNSNYFMPFAKKHKI